MHLNSAYSSARDKAKAVCAILIDEYGSNVSDRVMDSIAELVFTILSQNTADINTERAFRALTSTYSSWDAVLAAPQDALASVIRSSGPFRIKAKRIKAALGEIKNRVGTLDLSLLEKMDPNDAMDWLTSLHGVGPKTASIVLLFCFDMPLLPVDTHVWRISKRLGLVPNNVTREEAQKMLQEFVPKECVKSMNHNMINHGRNVCRSRKPLCDVCFLGSFCDYYSARARA